MRNTGGLGTSNPEVLYARGDCAEVLQPRNLTAAAFFIDRAQHHSYVSRSRTHQRQQNPRVRAAPLRPDLHHCDAETTIHAGSSHSGHALPIRALGRCYCAHLQAKCEREAVFLHPQREKARKSCILFCRAYRAAMYRCTLINDDS
jgi:hypothetical protein